MEVFSRAADKFGEGVHLLIGGEGSERGALEKLVRGKRLEAQVHMPGLVLDPAEAIGALDLFLTINVGPTTGIAALEAAFLGIPIIAVQLDAEYRMRDDDWIWSSSDLSAVAAECVRLLKNDAERQALAKKQQAHVKAANDVKVMAEAYYRLYDEAAEARNGSKAPIARLKPE